MIFSDKTILHITGEQLMACQWHHGSLSDEQYFHQQPEGYTQFANYLKQHKHPVCLMVDLVEEDFRVEQVPHTRGSKHQALIARKLEHYYRSSPFRLAMKLARLRQGRRDDEILFSALNNPQPILPWLELLLDAHIPVASIQSVPYLSASLLGGIAASHVLLLTYEKHAGLRQSYFQQQRLRFSRLTTISQDNSFANTIAVETPRTLQYLKSLHLPPNDEMLHACIVSHPRDYPAVEARLSDFKQINYALLDIQQLSDKLNIRTTCQDSDATALFLHLLPRNITSSNYASRSHRHDFSLWRLRRLLFQLAAITAVACITWSVAAFWQGQRYLAKISPVLSESARLEQQGRYLSAQLPIKDVTAAEMKSAIALAHELGNSSPQVAQMLDGLSLLLDQFEHIHLHKLSWHSDSSNTAAHPLQHITLEAELRDFEDDLTARLNYQDGFKQALGLQGYTLNAPPVDSNAMGNSNPQSGEASHFALELSWTSR